MEGKKVKTFFFPCFFCFFGSRFRLSLVSLAPSSSLSLSFQKMIRENRGGERQTKRDETANKKEGEKKKRAKKRSFSSFFSTTLLALAHLLAASADALSSARPRQRRLAPSDGGNRDAPRRGAIAGTLLRLLPLVGVGLRVRKPRSRRARPEQRRDGARDGEVERDPEARQHPRRPPPLARRVGDARVGLVPGPGDAGPDGDGERVGELAVESQLGRGPAGGRGGQGR